MEYPFKDLQPLDETTARTGYYRDWTHIDAETFHQISELVKFIREKGYGADTREAIAQALERVYYDAMKSGNADMELSMARKHFKSLAARLDASDNDLRNIDVNWINKNLGKLDQSFLTDELLLQIAGTAGLNAKPERNSVDLNEFSQTMQDLLAEIGEATVDDFKYRIDLTKGIYASNSALGFLEGKNLFSGEYNNQYIDTNNLGLVDFPDNTRRTTKPIPLYENKNVPLTISGNGFNRNVWIFINQYDEMMSTVLNDTTILPPPTARQAICYYYNASTDTPPSGTNVQIEFGDVASVYTPYSKQDIPANKLFSVPSERYYVVPYRTDLTQYATKKADNNDVYGVRFLINQSSPDLERIESSVGLESGVTVGDAEVRNDFDDVYPWSDIKVANVSKTDWGATKVIYQGETGFSFTGSSGDVMVEIPKHYVRRYQEGGYEYILISATPRKGFALDPAFVENGKELDKIYVGRYLNVFEGNVPRSKTGVYPSGRIALDTALAQSEAKGKGFSNYDFRTLQMIQRLFMVEYATRDSQSVFGGITKRVYHGKLDCRALASATNANQITVSIGYDSDKFRVGQRCAVAINQEHQDRRITNIVSNPSNGQRLITFNGAPVNITAGQTFIYSNPESNGETDTLPNLNGRLTGDSDKVSFSYRGIENLWGNLHEMVAGIYTKDGVAYYADSMSDYTDIINKDSVKATTFKLPDVPYTGALDATTPYIRTMGYDAINPLIMLPETAGTSTVGKDYWADEVNAPHDTKPQYLAHGGGWDHYERSGIFNYRFFIPHDQTDGGWLNGTRLIYKNI